MSSALRDPFPHAATVTASATPLTVAANALLLCNFAAGAASITVTTAGGETLTIALGTPTVANIPIVLPIQVTAVTAISNIGTVVALWH
jgi:hypothetical protein